MSVFLTLEEIKNSHPLKTKRHHLWSQAMQLVGERQAKGEFVELVNALLFKVEQLQEDLSSAEERLSTCLSFECSSLGPMDIPSAEERKELARKRRGELAKKEEK